jgi:hypothetical protein
VTADIVLTPVNSSNVAAVGYDPATARLYVVFRGGTLYAYEGVPPAVHAGLMAAPSKGRYLNDEIKGAYDYRRLDLEPATAA